MPPAPFKNGIFESATAIIEPIETSQVELELLDLIVPEFRDIDNPLRLINAQQVIYMEHVVMPH